MLRRPAVGVLVEPEVVGVGPALAFGSASPARWVSVCRRKEEHGWLGLRSYPILGSTLSEVVWRGHELGFGLELVGQRKPSLDGGVAVHK